MANKGDACMKKNTFIFILLSLIIGFLVIFSTKVFHTYHPRPSVGKNIHYTLINPLLKYMKFKEIKPFKDKIEELIKKEKDAGLASDIAVYFRSLAGGIWMGIDEKKEFAPASVLKIPIMLTYYRLAEKNPDILNKKIKYIRGNISYVSGVPIESSAEIGKYYSVDELIGLLITESDNAADKLLCDNLPPGELDKTFADFGINLAGVSPKGEFASLKICAGFLRVLYNASYLNEAFSEKALRYLEKSKYRDGIVAGLPNDVAVVHKFGERFYANTGEKQLHEFGIIYYPNNPYILGVMVRGKDYDSMSRVIKDISELVYKEVDAQHKRSNGRFSEDS